LDTRAAGAASQYIALTNQQMGKRGFASGRAIVAKTKQSLQSKRRFFNWKAYDKKELL
jgi:hypothetical protein